MIETLAALEPGHIVIRILGGEPMELVYLGTHRGLIHAGFGPDFHWTFDAATGMEVDDELQWGPAYGITGSYLAGVKTEDTGVDVAAVLSVWAEIRARLDPPTGPVQ